MKVVKERPNKARARRKPRLFRYLLRRRRRLAIMIMPAASRGGRVLNTQVLGVLLAFEGWFGAVRVRGDGCVIILGRLVDNGGITSPISGHTGFGCVVSVLKGGLEP